MIGATDESASHPTKKTSAGPVIVAVIASFVLSYAGSAVLSALNCRLFACGYTTTVITRFAVVLLVVAASGACAAALARQAPVRHAAVFGIVFSILSALSSAAVVLSADAGHPSVRPVWLYVPLVALVIPTAMLGGAAVAAIRRRRFRSRRGVEE